MIAEVRLNPKLATQIVCLRPISGKGKAIFVPNTMVDLDTGTGTVEDYRRDLNRLAAQLAKES